ncbi:MAG: glycosyltransferase family 39 protein [Jatrophihabitans sp.]
MTTTITPGDVPASTPWSRDPVDEGRADAPAPPRRNRPLIAGARGERTTLATLLVATAVLYLWGLGASGYANEFYSAAAQAGTQSWKAFFFGSFDSSNFITVDKPPAALWPMEISGRIFGFTSWSMLVPQAIEGVLAVWLLYASVRRWFGHGAGLLAGGLLALTPVAVLMFRFNNPDALMTLLIVLAAYCTTRAIESASTKWLLVAGAVMGFSFLAKGLQPFTVLPALALAYLVAAPTPLRRRLVQLLAAGAALVAGAGWWVLAVDLTAASSRPYIGGSGDNSALGLAFGYNGLDRLSGSTSGGGANFSGNTGFGRLFNDLNGGQISWLLPTAVVGLVALGVISRRRPRTDRTRAALLLWGGWLVVTAGVLSFAGGIIHTYYSVELAPAVAAVVAIGTVELWRARAAVAARLGLAAGVVVSAIWSYVLLDRVPSFATPMRPLLLALAIAATAVLLAPALLRRSGLVTAVAVAGVLVLGGGSAAYALNTAGTAHTGSTPSAGPASATGAGFGGPGGPGKSGQQGGPARGQFPGVGRFPGPPGSGQRGQTGRPPNAAGGPGGRSTANAALSALVKQTDTTWAAATIGSQTAGPLELATGKAVMAIGGFNGQDASPTLAQFQAHVHAGQIHYFIGGGNQGGPGGGRGTGGQISTWVAAHYTARTVGGSTVYDLTQPTS